MVATIRKTQVDVNQAVIAGLMKVLARYNPTLSKTTLEATGKAMAAVSIATSRLSIEQQRQIAADETELAHALEAAVAGLAAMPTVALLEVIVDRPVEVSQGKGMGSSISTEQGRQRLAEFATSNRIEDWAGPVAGPGEIEKLFGTKRSTLHDWQKRGAVIGLLKGERKHVFPLAQFVDGRPIEGMSYVVKIIQNPRAAWQWLTLSKPSIGGTPLEQLKHGYVETVVHAAERDFG